MGEKVIRNGKVAVLISKGFGSGWYTWNPDYKQLLFHPKLVEMVESNKFEEIEEWVHQNINPDIYCGGSDGLCIEWLEEGSAFVVDEYDGAESIKTLDDLTLIA